MTEATSNVELAHKIHEHGHQHGSPTDRRTQWVEIIEAVVLATVAGATAWSGYQASKWDAVSAKQYNLAVRTTVLAQEKSNAGGPGSTFRHHNVQRLGCRKSSRQ